MPFYSKWEFIFLVPNTLSALLKGFGISNYIDFHSLSDLTELSKVLAGLIILFLSLLLNLRRSTLTHFHHPVIFHFMQSQIKHDIMPFHLCFLSAEPTSSSFPITSCYFWPPAAFRENHLQLHSPNSLKCELLSSCWWNITPQEWAACKIRSPLFASVLQFIASSWNFRTLFHDLSSLAKPLKVINLLGFTWPNCGVEIHSSIAHDWKQSTYKLPMICPTFFCSYMNIICC